MPIGLDNYVCSVKKGSKEFLLTCWDIGNYEYENLRVLNYPNVGILYNSYL